MLHIGARNPNHVYTVNNVNISVVNSVKDLGVHVNWDLNWSLHVNEVVKKQIRSQMLFCMVLDVIMWTCTCQLSILM